MPSKTVSLAGASLTSRHHPVTADLPLALAATNFYISRSDRSLTVRSDLARFRDDVYNYSAALDAQTSDLDNWLVAIAASTTYAKTVYFTRGSVHVQATDGTPTNKMPTYTTGTVTTNGTTSALTGGSTAWLANVHPGALIEIDDTSEVFRIATVTSDTAATVDGIPTATTGTSTYTITSVHSYDRADYPIHFEVYTTSYVYQTTPPLDEDGETLEQETMAGPWYATVSASAVSAFAPCSTIYRSHGFGIVDSYVVLLNTREYATGAWTHYPRRIRWSAPGLVNDFSATGSGTADLTGAGQLLDARRVGHNLVLFESLGIGALYTTGDTTNPFQYKIISENLRIISNPIAVNDVVYFVAADGLLYQTNALEVQPVSTLFDISAYDDFDDAGPVQLTFDAATQCLMCYRPRESDDEHLIYLIEPLSGAVTALKAPVLLESGEARNWPRMIVQHTTGDPATNELPLAVSTPFTWMDYSALFPSVVAMDATYFIMPKPLPKWIEGYVWESVIKNALEDLAAQGGVMKTTETFTGTGSDDLAIEPHPSRDMLARAINVEIDGEDPDTFRWKLSTDTDWREEGVEIRQLTGDYKGYEAKIEGITDEPLTWNIRFTMTDGHVTGDTWTATAGMTNWEDLEIAILETMSYLNGIVIILGKTLGPIGVSLVNSIRVIPGFIVEARFALSGSVAPTICNKIIYSGYNGTSFFSEPFIPAGANPTFVALCDGGKVITNQDAYFTNAATSVTGASATTNFTDGAWNGRLFVIVSSVTGEIFTSPDGVTWTERTNPEADCDNFTSVAWNGTQWMIAGQNAGTLGVGDLRSFVMTSSNGISWTTTYSTAPAVGALTGLHDLTWVSTLAGYDGTTATYGGVWVARGRVYDGETTDVATVVYSADNGTTWTAVDPTMDPISRLARDGDRLVIMGTVGGITRIKTSTNITTWTIASQVPTDGSTSLVFDGYCWYSIPGDS